MAWRERCPDCLMSDKGKDCPLMGSPIMPCGFGAAEHERRKGLPLIWDEESGTSRKYVGIRKWIADESE